jgi:hypothetical protein
MRDFICEACKFLMVILGILGIGLIIWGVNENDKEKQSKLISDSYEQGYLDACKDFYRGKLKYELVKNDDGTVEWKKVGE